MLCLRTNQGEMPMDGKWGKLGASALLLAMVFGCRTVPPDVKPAESPEVLNRPPLEARYNSSAMPREAFNREDPSKRYRDLNDSQIMPARGSFGGPSGSMMR